MIECHSAGQAQPAFRALTHLLEMERPSRDDIRQALILLTGFGGHEQVLLHHMAADSSIHWNVYAVAEDPMHVLLLSEALPSNAKLLDMDVLPAYPSLRKASAIRAMAAAYRFLSRSKVSFDLVSSGDIGNFAYLAAMIRLSAGRSPVTYIPMPPRQRNRATILGRWAARRLVTISATEAGGFNPPADYVLRNMAPGHLARLQSSGIDNGRLNLYWIGRLEKNQKCPERSLTILRLLHDLGHAQAVLHIVGDGTELHNLKACAQATLPSDSVHFWGWLDFNSKTLPPLPRMHALLNTSNFEGIPLTLLDALELGIPCLVRRGAIADPELAEKLVEWQTEKDAADWIADHLAFRQDAPNV